VELVYSSGDDQHTIGGNTGEKQTPERLLIRNLTNTKSKRLNGFLTESKASLDSKFANTAGKSSQHHRHLSLTKINNHQLVNEENNAFSTNPILSGIDSGLRIADYERRRHQVDSDNSLILLEE
jgi:hypothetical protein